MYIYTQTYSEFVFYAAVIFFFIKKVATIKFEKFMTESLFEFFMETKYILKLKKRCID